MAPTTIRCRSAKPLVLGLALVWGLWAGLNHSRLAKADEDDLLTVPELLVPKRGQDVSAYRFDSDVFGWNKSFTQVAGISSDVTRGPKGKHRGEVFMVVYPVGHSVPVHNIQVHVITHADFPDDPVPLDDVRDMMWTLENPTWLDKWPKRPHRKPAKGFMKVTPIWDPMSADTLAHSVAGPPGFETAPAMTDQAQCTPGVGFILHYKGHTRVVPHVGLDLKARCDLLKLKDNRIYWAKPDLAVDMARFDFSPKPTNEESARFVVSAAWHQAEAIHFVASAGHPMDMATRRLITHATQNLGPVRFVTQAKHKPVDDAEALVAITAAPKWLALGRRVARSLGAGNIDIAADEAAGATLTLYFGVPKAMAPPAPPPSPQDSAAALSQTPASGASNMTPVAPPPGFMTPSTHPVFGASVPQKIVDSPTPESATLPLPDKTRNTTPMSPKSKSYLDDWRVP